MINEDISPDAPISIFEFGTDVDLIYRFNMLQSPRDDMIQALEDADFDAGWTATATAIEVGINEWERAIAAGNELNDGQRLLFIMTDGEPNRGGYVYFILIQRIHNIIFSIHIVIHVHWKMI